MPSAVAVRREVDCSAGRHARAASVEVEGSIATAARGERRDAAASITLRERHSHRAASVVAAHVRAVNSSSVRAEPATVAVRRDVGRPADCRARVASVVVEGSGFAFAARGGRRDAAASTTVCEHRNRRVTYVVAARVRFVTSSSGRAEPAAVAVRRDIGRPADCHARVASVAVEGSGFAAAARGERRGAAASLTVCEHRAHRATSDVSVRVRAVTSSSVSAEPTTVTVRRGVGRPSDCRARVVSAVVEGSGFAAVAQGERRDAAANTTVCEHRACRAASAVAVRVRAVTSSSGHAEPATVAVWRDVGLSVGYRERVASVVVEGSGFAAAARGERCDVAASTTVREHRACTATSAVAVRAVTSSSVRAEPASVAVRRDVGRPVDCRARVVSAVVEGSGFAAAARGERRDAAASLTVCSLVPATPLPPSLLMSEQ